MLHRGPDECGLFRDRNAGLVHVRLSIIDLATGQQPLANEDGTIWVVFNGEIFNYLELREELSALGHTFRTRSDTEVIVHAWESWGEQAFERFNGQFAIALWDSPRGGAGAGAGPAWGSSRLPLRARGRSVVRERGQGDLRRRPVHPPGTRSGRPRRDLHLLDGGPAAVPVPGGDRARARPRPTGLPPRHERPRLLVAPLPCCRRGRVPGFPPGGRGACPGGTGEGGAAAHAALRRFGGELPLRWPRQLRHRRHGTEGERGEVLDLFRRVRGRRVRRALLPARRGHPHRKRPPGGSGSPIRHRRLLPRRSGPRGTAPAADRASAALPPLPAGAGRGHQGSAHRRGSRRDVRGLRHLPGGQGAPLLGPAAWVR